MVESTPSDAAVTINEKNDEDTIDKLVREDSEEAYRENNDAQIGDTIEFKSRVTVVARSVNVKVHDTMYEGLTLNANSIKLYSLLYIIRYKGPFCSHSTPFRLMKIK